MLKCFKELKVHFDFMDKELLNCNLFNINKTCELRKLYNSRLLRIRETFLERGKTVMYMDPLSLS